MSEPGRCPRRAGLVVRTATGELRPARCSSYVCGWCGPRLALATVEALVLAEPHTSAVLTFRHSLADRGRPAEEGFAAFHRSLGSLAAGLRKTGHVWEAAWLVELSPRGIPHVHLLQSGTTVPLSVLSHEATAAGFGWARSQPIRHLRTIARYVMKAPLRGLDLGPSAATKVMRQHLELNGGWLIRWTRCFWRAADGSELHGVRRARIDALRLREQLRGARRG
jgi:hypothetical protein